MPRTAKKKAAKRAYNKKPKTVPVEESPKELVDELTFLDMTVKGVEQLTTDQKSRFMNYIYSRYWQFITLSKLTQ